MSVLQMVNLAVVLWGALVLAAGTIRYYYFDRRCIHIELPVHPWRRGLRKD